MAVRKNNKTGKWYYDTHDSYGNHLQKHGFAKKAEAIEAERIAKKSKIKSGITYDLLTNELCEEYETHLSARTLNEYRSIYKKHICPFIKNQELYKYHREDGEYVKKKLLQEGRTIYVTNHALEMMKRTMNFGVKKGYIDINPFGGIPKLKYPKKIKEYLTYDEFVRAIEHVNNRTYRDFFEVAFWTGIRRGEILALQWKDVRFDDRTIYVHQHVIYPGNGMPLVLEGRKNGSGYFVELDDDLYELLKKRYEYCSQIDGFSEDLYVFGDYTPLAPENPRRQLKKMLEQAGITKEITLHSFRHSHVSYLYNYTDLSLQQIAQRIGDTIEVVLSTYAHIFKARPGEFSGKIMESKKRFEPEKEEKEEKDDSNNDSDEQNENLK